MRISDWSSDVCSSDLVNSYLGQPDEAIVNRHRNGGGHLFGGDGVFRPWHVINVVEPKPLTITFLGTKNRLSEKFDSHRVGIVVQKIAAPHGFADLLAEALAEQKADLMYRVDRNNFIQNDKKRSEDRRVGKECVSTCRSRGDE